MKRLFTAALFCLFWAGAAQAQTPAAPTILKGSTISSTRIDLRWTDNSSNETSFRVERCDRGAPSTSSSPYGVTVCTSFSEIGSTAANATAYSDTTVSANSTYIYRVRARNGSGDSSYTTSSYTWTPASGTLSVLKAYPSSDIVRKDTQKTFTLWAENGSGAQMKFIYPVCTSSNTSVLTIVPHHSTDLASNNTNFWNVTAYDDGRVQVYRGIAAGTATVTCTLGSVSDTISVTVYDPAGTPSPSIGGDVSSGAASVKTLQPLEIDLTSAPAGASSVRIEWGDGDETTDVLSAVHAYRSAGTKTLKVTFTNSSGASAYTTATVTVSDLVCSSTLTATSLSDLLTKYNAATGGECIQLAPGSYTGQLSLPARTWTTGDGWVTLMSSGTMPSFEERISLADDAAQMVRIDSNSANQSPVKFQNGVNHVRLIGFRGEMTASTQGSLLFEIGSGASTVEADQPSNLIIQHCGVSNPHNNNYQQAVWNSGYKVSIVSSEFTNVFFIGVEAHAYISVTAKGAHSVYNSEFEAAGVPFFYGGARIYVEDTNPTNVEVRRCFFWKRLSWREDGTNKAIKNLFELKAVRRIYVRDCYFKQHWGAGQFYAIVVKTNAETDDSPWSVTEDVVFENGWVNHASGGFNATWDLYNNSVTRQVHGTKFKNFFWEDISGATWGQLPRPPGSHGFGMLLQGITNLEFNHVTMVMPDNHTIHFAESYGTPGLSIKNSVFGLGGAGIRSADYTQGSATLSGASGGDYTFTRNMAIAYGPDITGLSTNYPSYNVNNKYPATVADAKFVDDADGDYRLESDSPGKNFATDGTDAGVNFMTLQTALGASGLPLSSATVNVESGDWTGGGGSAPAPVKARGKVKLRGRLKLNP